MGSMPEALFRDLESALKARGYRPASRSGPEPGTYTTASDAGPGWSSWVFWLDVYEGPANPIIDELEALVAAYRTSTRRG